MVNKNIKAIDPERLDRALKEKGYTACRASREFGLSDSAISNWKKRKEIPLYGMKLLEGIGVSYEEYRREKIVQVETLQREIGHEEHVDRISNAISSVDTHLLMMYEELVKLNQFFEKLDPAKEKEDHDN